MGRGITRGSGAGQVPHPESVAPAPRPRFCDSSQDLFSLNAKAQSGIHLGSWRMTICRSFWRPAVLLLPVPAGAPHSAGYPRPPRYGSTPRFPALGLTQSSRSPRRAAQHPLLCNPTKSPVMGAAGSGDQGQTTFRNVPGTPSPPFRPFSSPFPPFSHLSRQNVMGKLRHGVWAPCWGDAGGQQGKYRAAQKGKSWSSCSDTPLFQERHNGKQNSTGEFCRWF